MGNAFSVHAVRVVPLLGAHRFSELMRQRPQKSWDLCFVHACVYENRCVYEHERAYRKNELALQTKSQTALVDRLIRDNQNKSKSEEKCKEKEKGNASQQIVIRVGQIIPKKAYKLAVDRNRIRRLVRAHSLSAMREYLNQRTQQTNLCAIQMDVLFRIKALDKKARADSQKTQTNPHTDAFSQTLKVGLLDAFKNAFKQTLDMPVISSYKMEQL